MNSIIMIREAEEKDLPQLRKILDYYIRETAVNFDFETPSEEAFAALWRSHRACYPFLVVQEGDTDHLLGYAYAGPFVGKSAYQWSAELTIYLDPARLHEGLLNEGLVRQGLKGRTGLRDDDEERAGKVDVRKDRGRVVRVDVADEAGLHL